MKSIYFDKIEKFKKVKHCKIDCPFRDEFNNTLDEMELVITTIEILSQVNRLILEHTNENNLIHETCKTICRNENFNFTAIAYFDESINIPFLSATSDYNSPYNQMLTKLISSSELLNFVKNNKTILITTENKTSFGSNIIIQNNNEIPTSIILPLKDNLDNSFGMLLIISNEQNSISEEEIKVLEDLAQDLSIAITRIRLREKQNKIQSDLEISEKKYRLIADSSLDVISVINNDGTILYTSPAIKSLLGYNPDEIINKSVYDLINSKDLPRVRKVFQITINKNATGKVRYRAKKKDGEYIWLESSGKSVIDNNSVKLQITTRDISDRIEYEHKLVESEKRLKLALSATNTGLWDWNIPENKIYLSKGYFELLGFDYDEYKDVKEFWRFSTHPEDLPELDILIRELIEAKVKELEHEYRKIKKDGQIIWVLNKGAVAEWDDDGNPIRLMGTVTDITNRKTAELLLRQSEEKYRLIVEHSHDGIEISQDEKFIYWNKQFADMLGYSYEELNQITFRDIYTPEGLVSLYKRHEQRTRGEIVPKSYETTLRKKDGTKIIVQINYEIFDFNGKPATFATIKDITDQKKAEESLKSSEQFLQKSLDSLSSNIAVLDEVGNIIAVNKRWKEFGIQNGLKEKDFCVGINYIRICEKANGEDSDIALLVANEIKQMLKGTKSEFHIEYPCHSPKEKRWFIAHFTAFKHDDKPMVIVAHENITERKIAEQNIIEAKEKAEEANNLKSTFLLNMSHELRTPLVGILGFAEVLSYELENEEHKKMVETIYESGRRLLETLSLILNLSKVEAGKEEVNISEFNVNSVCSEVANLFTAQAKKKNLTITLDFKFSELIIKSDARLVRDVINNLVSNAIKFTNEGRITLSTFITNYKERSFIAVEVSDTGIGIPEDKLDIIFEEFRQVSEGMNRSFEGTGLGLALAKKIMLLLGGEITVQSKVGVGSKFTVYFPSGINLYQMNYNQKLLPPPENKQFTFSDIIKTKRILVVEDDWVSRKFIEVVLKDYCQIEFAMNGVDALEKTKNAKYDAILMDINLGRGMDGLTVTRLIREKEDYKAIPIAALTAFASQQDREEFLEKGCSHYLSKPFSKTALINLINDMLKVE